MPSSTSSPFKLGKVVVNTNDKYVFKNDTYYARFMFLEAGLTKRFDTLHDVLRVGCYVEVAHDPWLTHADRIGASARIGSIGAEVLFDPTAFFDINLQDALWFACQELNPMLESMTTLKGIEHNIDIVVEHGLRPTNKLLQNLVQPRKHIVIRRR